MDFKKGGERPISLWQSNLVESERIKEVPLFAILTRNISSNFSPEFLLICEYNS